MIRLRTLGECVIEVDGESYTPEADALFAALLYLSAERGRRVPRQHLAELLWPHHDATRARHCLRQLLYRMRIAGGSVEGGRDTLFFPERLVVPTFSAAPAAERLVAERIAGTLVIGRFLPGYEPRLSDRFIEWVEHHRGAMEARVRRVLLEVAHAHRLRGEWEQVDALATEVLGLDPLNEEATLARAEATAMVGAKSEALDILDRFVAELGPDRSQLHLPATVLRRRIAERFPSRRYGGPSERCFVGRSGIMETLSTALLRARNGEGSGVLLTGAPGIGKTRLVHEVTKVASMQGIRVVRVSTVESDVERPLSAFADAVPQLRALPGAIGVSPDSLAFLDRLTEVHPVGGVREDDVADPRWIASRIRQSVVDLCDAVSGEGTILLLIDDVHWLDASSWAVIAALLEWLPSKRFLLLMTSRGPHPTAVTPQRCVEKLAVYPVLALSDEFAGEYVRAIVQDHGGSLTPDAVAWCVSVGEGNPLFLRELVVHCLEGGPSGVMPTSLHGLLDLRLARLSDSSRRVLEAAAILGEFASADRLLAMLELPVHGLASTLAELSREQIIADAETPISSSHALLAARVVRTIEPAVRRLLHARAATVLSGSAGAETPEILLAAASHWRDAGNPSRALSTLLDAANAVERLGAVRDATRLLEAALVQARSATERATVLRLLIPPLTLDYQLARANAVAAELLELAQTQPESNSRSRDSLLAIRTQFRAGALPSPLLDTAFGIAADTSLTVSIRLSAARLGVIVATQFSSKFDYEAVLQLTREASQDPSVDKRELLSLLLVFHVNFGELATAIGYADELRTLASSDSDTLRRLGSLMNVAQAEYHAGLDDAARTSFHVVRREAQKWGGHHFEIQAVLSLLTLATEEGNLTECAHWWNAATSLPSVENDPLLRALLAQAEARLRALQGRTLEAMDMAADCLVRARAAPNAAFWEFREAITIRAQLLLCVSADPLPNEILDDLALCHQQWRDRPLHDRTAASLIAALERAGRENEARQVEVSYLATHRRSLLPWRSAAAVLSSGVRSTR